MSLPQFLGCWQNIGSEIKGFVIDNTSSSQSVSICAASLRHSSHRMVQGGPGNAVQVVGYVAQEESDLREPESFITGSNLSELCPEQ